MEDWMTEGILTSRRTKLKLARQLSISPNEENKNRFKNYKKLYNKVIRLRKKMYYNDKITSNQGNLKNTWDTIKQATGLKKGQNSRVSN